MRQERISYARCGELELRLELAPAPSPAIAASSPEDVVDDERQLLEELLHSSGAEAEPFLRAMRKAV